VCIYIYIFQNDSTLRRYKWIYSVNLRNSLIAYRTFPNCRLSTPIGLLPFFECDIWTPYFYIMYLLYFRTIERYNKYVDLFLSLFTIHYDWENFFCPSSLSKQRQTSWFFVFPPYPQHFNRQRLTNNIDKILLLFLLIPAPNSSWNTGKASQIVFVLNVCPAISCFCEQISYVNKLRKSL
jgi:hypothetical protein